MGPLPQDDGPRGARWSRRARGIAIEALAFVVLTLLSPLVLPLAAVVDLALWLVRRKPWMGVRLLAFAWWFLLGELRGLVALGLAWALSGGRDTARRRRAVYVTRHRWARRHLDGVRWLFDLTWEVEGLEDAAPGRVLVLIRHASIIDNMLADDVVGNAHGLGLRYVLKHELKALPTIDIGGRMVPTCFVRRASADSAGEVAKLRDLCVDVGPDEGVLIYPEGTRYTAEKLARAQEVIREKQPQVAPYADRLRHVLPPRLGGPLELLDAGTDLDVVVCGHVGLDGFEYVSDIWAGGLVGSTVRIRFWRHPRSSVPDGHDDRVAWLYARWQELDDWIGEQRHEGLGGAAPKAAAEHRAAT